jgi:hypothetical protein
VVSCAQWQRYPKNTPEHTLFYIKHNETNTGKYTITSNLQQLAYIHRTSFRYFRYFQRLHFSHTREKFPDIENTIMNSWLDNECPVRDWEKEQLLHPLHVLPNSAIHTTLQQSFRNISLSGKYKNLKLSSSCWAKVTPDDGIFSVAR